MQQRPFLLLRPDVIAGVEIGEAAAGIERDRSIARPPAMTAWNVRLPLNQTSTGQVTSAVRSFSIFALPASGLPSLVAVTFNGAPFSANCTCSTTGDGIWPSCRTVTVVRVPAVVVTSCDRAVHAIRS